MNAAAAVKMPTDSFAPADPFDRLRADLEIAAIDAGVNFRLFYTDGWRFVVRPVPGGLAVTLRFFDARGERETAAQPLSLVPASDEVTMVAAALTSEALSRRTS